MYPFVWLLLISLLFLRFVHVVLCISSSFFDGWVPFHCMYILQSVYFPVDRHVISSLGLYKFLEGFEYNWKEIAEAIISSSSILEIIQNSVFIFPEYFISFYKEL